MTEWRPSGYWDDIEAAQQALMELLSDACGEQWTLRGAAVTGASGSLLHVLVLRHRLGDSGPVLRLGYATADLDDHSDPVGWSDNYLDMRLQGSLPQALDALLAGGSLGDSQDPPALDAREASLEADATVLTAPYGEIANRGQDGAETDESGPVECQRCGERIPRQDATVLSGDLGEIWVHDGGCPE